MAISRAAMAKFIIYITVRSVYINLKDIPARLNILGEIQNINPLNEGLIFETIDLNL